MMLQQQCLKIIKLLCSGRVFMEVNLLCLSNFGYLAVNVSFDKGSLCFFVVLSLRKDSSKSKYIKKSIYKSDSMTEVCSHKSTVCYWCALR